jgi:phage gp37-like protein
MTGIAEVENAIIARLKAAGEAGVLGYRFRTVESYPENFDLYLKEKIKGDRAYPAAWVVFGGWRNPVDLGDEVQVEAAFGVVVAAKSLRNETAQRHGGGPANEPGSYQLLQDAIGLIQGHSLGLEIGGLQLNQTQPVRPTQTILENKLSVFASEFRTRMTVARNTFGSSALTDFSTFNVNWDLPPLAELEPDPETGASLPADDVVEATDRVEMPS